MTNLMRWDPFTPGMHRAMDILEDFTPIRVMWRNVEPTHLSFPTDLFETDDHVVVKAILPGIKPEDIDISVSEGVLTIKGETRFEEKSEKENYYRQEIHYGAFSRSIPLPTRVNDERAEAEFADGMLTVRLPKAEEVRPKSIKIRARGEQPELVGAANGTSSQS